MTIDRTDEVQTDSGAPERVGCEHGNLMYDPAVRQYCHSLEELGIEFEIVVLKPK